MGRNATPKLGEWRDGELHSIAHGDGTVAILNSGKLIVYTATWHDGMSEIRACCYADGETECLASFWQSGYFKGFKAGVEKAQADMRAALGLTKDGA